MVLLPRGVQGQEADGGGELVGGICERRTSTGSWRGISSSSTSTHNGVPASTCSLICNCVPATASLRATLCFSAGRTCDGTEQG